MNERIVYLNGEFIPESEAKVSIYDESIMYGASVFTMTRSFNKKTFKIEDHVRRVVDGSRYYDIDIDFNELLDIFYAVIDINDPLFSNDDEHRIMCNIGRGILPIYQDIRGTYLGTSITVADFPLKLTTNGIAHLYYEGINVIIPNQKAIPSYIIDQRIKNRNRLHFIKANIEIANYEGKNNWALLTDDRGFITECTGANFFIIKDGVIYTPKTINILNGISRQYVINELVPEMYLKVVEKDLLPYDVLNADEAFVTATPFCILPVVSINGMNIGDGKLGYITDQLLETWSQNVDVDIVNQILRWSKEDCSNKMVTSPYSYHNK